MPLPPDLPDALEDELADVLFRCSTAREERLQGLIARHPKYAAIFEARRAALEEGDDPGDSERLPGFDAYEVLRLLGKGGMGTVYLARQHEPIERDVAVKVLRGGSSEVIARFEIERQALAVMTHPAIAKIFDAGVTESGQPFFVMEHVAGLPLDEYCDTRRLTIHERIAVFQQICKGVHHAHRKGVVHRDLKPSNILVEDSTGEPVVKIIDFGLARAMDERLLTETPQTLHGQLLGTPEYMSPEQAIGDSQQIDTRTDIYSLGVLLYELLSGVLPLDSTDLRAGSALMIRQRILNADPPNPSTRVASFANDSDVLAARRLTRATLCRELKGELDWIVMCAIEHEPERRYDSPLNLARDLERYLANEPVLAGPPSATYRVHKFVRRNRARVIAGCLLLVSIVVGGVTAYVQYLRAEANATESRESADDLARKIKDFDQLAGVVLLDEVQAAEAALYPAWPSRIVAMEAWLAGDAAKLMSLRTDIVQTIGRLREQAFSPRPLDGSARTWTFGDELQPEAFLYDTLVALSAELTSLQLNEFERVKARLTWARRLSEDNLSLAHPRARYTWEAVRHAIATSPRYAGCTLELRAADVMDLVPIGCNPATGYWEFYHLPSAWDRSSDPGAISIPEHRADGSIEVTGTTGIVFVLLPGGDVHLGSQHDDASAPYYVAGGDPNEQLHAVNLPPFFLARHEVTQAQWARLWGWDPAKARPSRYSANNTVAGQDILLTNPVEMVDWTMCATLAHRHGLTLPAEAQWEYACRGGTTTPFQVEMARLREFANVADATAKQAYRDWVCDTWTDGFVVHAPVGSFAPNAFGLFDMHGNVWEWCDDWYGPYTESQVEDGLSADADSRYRCYRGGGARKTATYTRSARRDYEAPTFRNATLGLRLARELHPGE